MPNIAQDAGTMLLVGFEGGGSEETWELFRRVRPSGVIFFQRNIESEEQFRHLVRRVSEPLGPSPLLATDQEGGTVDRFRELLGPLPSAEAAARAGMGRELGCVAGQELAAFSLNVDFAPVLDVATPESRRVLGSRTAGETAATVIEFARGFLQGLAEAGIAGCGKHFPGLGCASVDSHLRMPVVSKSARQLWEIDMAPFRALAAELPMIMVAHAWYPALQAEGAANDSERLPASLSGAVVSNWLRKRMGYAGVVVCDDLEMGGALEGRDIGEAAVQAVRAGCDLLLVCRRAANVERVWQALREEAETEGAFREQLAAAAARVREAKEKLWKRNVEREEPLPISRLRMEVQRLREEVGRRVSRSSGQRGDAAKGERC